MNLNAISAFIILAASSCCDAFLAPKHTTTHSHATSTTTSSMMQLQQLHLPSTMCTSTTMFYTHGHHGNVSSLPDTTDPFVILNLHSSQHRSRANIDIKEIKKAYRSMALIYHPDARTGTNATDEERQMANDDFARINAAYAFLMNNKHRQKSMSSKEEDGYNNTGRGGAETEPSQHQPTRTPRHTQSERMKKQQHQQYVQNQRRNNVENHAKNSFYESVHWNRPRRRASEVQGYDINGNPRTKSTASAKASTSPSSSNAGSKGRTATSSFFDNFHKVQDNFEPKNTAPRTASPNANVNAKANTASTSFSKGDKVTIVGGAYGGRSGVVQNIYPTMVKVSISPSVDCFVDTRELRLCTDSKSDLFGDRATRVGNGNGTGTGTSFGLSGNQNANPNGYSFNDDLRKNYQQSPPTGYDGHGYYNDLRKDYCAGANDLRKDYYAGAHMSGDANAKSAHSGSGPSNNSARGASAPNSNPYGNYVEDLRGFNVNWKTVNAMHTKRPTYVSQSPDDTSGSSSTSTGTGTTASTSNSTYQTPDGASSGSSSTSAGMLNSADDTSSESSGAITPTSTSTFNTNYSNGSYSWRPSSGVARKKENVYRLNIS